MMFKKIPLFAQLEDRLSEGFMYLCLHGYPLAILCFDNDGFKWGFMTSQIFAQFLLLFSFLEPL